MSDIIKEDETDRTAQELPLGEEFNIRIETASRKNAKGKDEYFKHVAVPTLRVVGQRIYINYYSESYNMTIIDFAFRQVTQQTQQHSTVMNFSELEPEALDYVMRLKERVKRDYAARGFKLQF